ncbi:FMN-binding negative transcriptional regulator [Aeromonas cavernicola]|uniref:Transcriptional regulator n=1 Tax=Aeromonas cavernicola TaxID=1006623 RepID=A0A2H9U3Y6_9GAMM|nr:FMN-binding negative transcriptional regulator [Aeromonas cavernicola]PJG58752.1 transcriptional regulator [Aeromonas cavernicola]
MYLPAPFAVSDPSLLHPFILAHPLGALVTYGEQGLDANHLPFALDSTAGELGILRAHVARNNPLWQELQEGSEVLVIFKAVDGYISPSSYPSKQIHHRQVPTWNYSVVHAHGRIAIHDDARFIRRLLANQTRHHEAAEAMPWKMADAPRDYIETMVQAVVGIEIEISRLIGKFKLGQNKDEADRLGAADALQAKGATELAQMMREPPASTK